MEIIVNDTKNGDRKYVIVVIVDKAMWVSFATAMVKGCLRLLRIWGGDKVGHVALRLVDSKSVRMT